MKTTFIYCKKCKKVHENSFHISDSLATFVPSFFAVEQLTRLNEKVLESTRIPLEYLTHARSRTWKDW